MGEKRMKRTDIRRSVILFGLGTLIAGTYAAFKLWHGEYVKLTVLLADSLTLPGIIFTGIGAIEVIADSGVYDLPLYALRGFSRLLTGKGESEGYYEFKTNRSKDASRRRSLVVGGTYLAAAALLCFL